MPGPRESGESRRNFLVHSGLLVAATALWGAACTSAPETREVPPTEDLMREHGILRRLMLIYDNLGQRLQGGEEFPLPVLVAANQIIRRFMQDYHETNEQFHVFKWFGNAAQMVELVAILYQQHLAGRRLIDRVNVLSAGDQLRNPAARLKVAELLKAFNQVYRRHAAWEDTVLFPAFRSVIPPKDFEAVGQIFKREEHKKFGPDGYEKMVVQVADLEKSLGIHDLHQFTPKV